MQSINHNSLLTDDRYQLKYSHHQTSIPRGSSSYRKITQHIVTNSINANVD
jgi:hypothetical protein